MDISLNGIDTQLRMADAFFKHAREGIMVTDLQGTILEVNAAFTRITGYGCEEVLGQNPRLLGSKRQDKVFYAGMWQDLQGKGHWSGEIWNRRKDGQVIAEMLTINAVFDDSGLAFCYLALFSDITATKNHESQLDQLAHYDSLTKLPNRLLLTDRLKQGASHVLQRSCTLAVVYIDLDGFKAVNDSHGHVVGDQLLIAVADHMKQALREGDTLARIGGDEFVALLMDLENVGESVPLLNRLMESASKPWVVNKHELQISASLGVTFYPQEQDIDAYQLLRQSGQAMYQAKMAGKNRYHIFDASLDQSVRVHNVSLERMRLALEKNEFVLYYQPKVNMRSGKVIGVEALIRWQHPEQGLLAPAQFLPVIEANPLAIALGEWVINTALCQLEDWKSAGLDLPVSVNVGALQLQQADFVERLRMQLAAHPAVNPARLELEILETSALKDIAMVSQVIEACSQMGIKFALDDFGTGYSSLTYLKRLQVSLLKIDQSFVRDMLNDLDDLAILEGVIGLANAFSRDVIAEGVESIEHGSLLMQLGCDLAQGYGIARPMPADQLLHWVATWKPDPSWSAVSWFGDDNETKT